MTDEDTTKVEREEPPAKTLFQAAKDAQLGINTIQLWTTEEFHEFEDEDVSMRDALQAAKECFEETPDAVLVRLVVPLYDEPTTKPEALRPACMSADKSAVMSQVDPGGRFAVVHVLPLTPTVSKGMLC